MEKQATLDSLETASAVTPRRRISFSEAGGYGKCWTTFTVSNQFILTLVAAGTINRLNFKNKAVERS